MIIFIFFNYHIEQLLQIVVMIFHYYFQVFHKISDTLLSNLYHECRGRETIFSKRDILIQIQTLQFYIDDGISMSVIRLHIIKGVRIQVSFVQVTERKWFVQITQISFQILKKMKFLKKRSRFYRVRDFNNNNICCVIHSRIHICMSLHSFSLYSKKDNSWSIFWTCIIVLSHSI